MKCFKISLIAISLILLFGCSKATDNKTNNKESAVQTTHVQTTHDSARYNELVSLYLGKKIPYSKFNEIGRPQTLSGTDNNHWVAYFPKADFTIRSNKETDIIKAVFVGKRE